LPETVPKEGDSLQIWFVILYRIWASAEGEMRPRERRETGEQDLFRSRLDQIIDMNHPLAQLARTVDWKFLEGGASAKSTPMIPVTRRCRRD
jgi:hypothetical protein